MTTFVQATSYELDSASAVYFDISKVIRVNEYSNHSDVFLTDDSVVRINEKFGDIIKMGNTEVE
jgi:hypothetical protein